MLGPEEVTSSLLTDIFSVPAEIQENYGIIPRAIFQVFDHINAGVHEHIEFSIKCSYIEIYNESVNDLLTEKPTLNLKIREFPTLGMCVIGMTERFITSPLEIFECLALGTLNRITGATCQNTRSSRSHSLFIISMEQKFFNGSVKTSKLSLVDLAGSEKVAKSGASGQQLKEAQNINLSLTTLGRCIKALASSKNEHIPFRESKLTMILKEALGGNAKTVLLCTVSQKLQHKGETQGTLKFAERAKKVQIKARSNVREAPEELAALISQLKEDVNSLRKQLREKEEIGGKGRETNREDENLFIQYTELKAKYEHLNESAQLEIEELKQKFEQVFLDSELTSERLQSVLDELDEKNNIISQLKEDCDRSKYTLEREVISLKVKTEGMEREAEILRQENGGLSKKLMEERRRLDDQEKAQFDLQEKCWGAESMLSTERIKVEELGKRLERKTEEMDILELEKGNMTSQLSALHEEIGQLQAANFASENRVSDLESKLEILTNSHITQASELSYTKTALFSAIQTQQIASEQESKSLQTIDFLRNSIAELLEKNQILEKRLETMKSEPESSRKQSAEGKKPSEHERKTTVSKEMISKLMREMMDLQQIYSKTQVQLKNEIALAKQGNLDRITMLEKRWFIRSLDEMGRKMQGETEKKADLERVLKLAEVEQDSLRYHLKLMKEEVISATSKLAETAKSEQKAKEEASNLHQEIQNLKSSLDSQSSELKRHAFDSQKISKEAILALEAKISRLETENLTLRKSLSEKEIAFFSLKMSEETKESELKEKMAVLQDSSRTERHSGRQRMSLNRLSGFAQKINQEVRLSSQNPNIELWSSNLQGSSPVRRSDFCLPDVRALYSIDPEEEEPTLEVNLAFPEPLP